MATEAAGVGSHYNSAEQAESTGCA